MNKYTDKTLASNWRPSSRLPRGQSIRVHASVATQLYFFRHDATAASWTIRDANLYVTVTEHPDVGAYIGCFFCYAAHVATRIRLTTAPRLPAGRDNRLCSHSTHRSDRHQAHIAFYRTDTWGSISGDKAAGT